MHLAAALENPHAASNFELILILLSGFTEAVSIPRILDAIELVADEELVGTIEDRFIAAGFDFATILSSPFLFLHPLRHRFFAAGQAEILSAANRAEIADVKQMKKIAPFVTCEITLCQNVCELVFGINIFHLNVWIQVDSVK